MLVDIMCTALSCDCRTKHRFFTSTIAYDCCHAAAAYVIVYC